MVSLIVVIAGLIAVVCARKCRSRSLLCSSTKLYQAVDIKHEDYFLLMKSLKSNETTVGGDQIPHSGAIRILTFDNNI